jgi:hypothetical protein
MAEVTMETMNWEWIDETAQQTELDGMMGCIEEAQENITDGLYLRMMNHLKNINNKYSVKERNKTLRFAQEYHDECHDEIRRLFRTVAMEKEQYVRDMNRKDKEIADLQSKLGVLAEMMTDEKQAWEVNSLRLHHNKMWKYSLDNFEKKDTEIANQRILITELEWKLIQELQGQPFGVRVFGNPQPLLSFDGSSVRPLVSLI